MKQQDEKSTILVVDDEPQILTSIEDLLEREFLVRTTTDPGLALQWLQEDRVAVIVSDQRMPEMSGDEFLGKAKEISQAMRILLTGYADLDALVRAVNYGQIYSYVAKPWNPLELRMTIQKAARHYALMRENERLTVELRQTNADLDAANHAMLMVLNSTAEGICGLDDRGNIAFVNPAAARTAGWEVQDLIGKPLHDVLHHTKADGSPYPPEECPKHAVLKNGTRCDVQDEVFWKKDGTSFPVEYTAAPMREDGKLVGSVVTFRDVTERKQLQEQLLQSQKMEVLGQLVGGVAHDFNNLLTAISGYANLLLLSHVGPDSDVGRDLVQIRELADRAAGLTRQLLAFGRRQKLETRVINLNQLINNTSKMLGRLLDDHISLKFIPQPDLGNVRADPGQIEQVLMNLTINARDAMPNGGKLLIGTMNVNLAEEHAARYPEVKAGPYVMLSVVDDGCGMDEATLKRIFEPFFTTKEPGKGTGLGLSTVFGIVKQHGGDIQVESVPGKGTAFRIWLPRVEEKVEEQSEKASEKPLPPGSETILVVDEEDGVRTVAQRLLEGLGYKVLSAAGADEAEKIFASRGHEIALLLTDVSLSGESGPNLYRRLVAQRPSLKVLFMSGYTDSAAVRNSMPDRDAPLLEKPFLPSTLAQKIRKALDKKRKGKILIVDDEPDVVRVLKGFLEGNGYTVATAATGAEGLRKIRQVKPQVVLLDVIMPGKSGLEVLQEIKDRHPEIGVIMITGVEDKAVGYRALKMGAFDYIAKPFDPGYLQKALSWQLWLIS